MDKLGALEEFLPGFQDFLSDLALINLTTALKEKLSVYQRNISDYVEKHTEAPSAPLPPVPTASTAGNKAPVIDLDKERETSWRISKADGPNDYQNTTFGGEPPEDFYETPMQDAPPALPPTTSRPPIKRVVDATEDVYEDPDDQESGRGSMPPGSCSDEGSGNTFVFPQKDKTDLQIEEDFNSDSTEYEDVEDIDQELQRQEKQKKPKVDKLEEFKNEHKHEEDIDLIDRLLMLNNYFSTIKSVGKWEKRYCIAKDGQLFIYKSYKDKQSKAQRLPLMGYTVFLLGQQGKQDNVIKIDHHSNKTPLLIASESADVSNKWLAVLQKYSTINHTIVPGQPDDDDIDESPEKKKGTKLFSREKKDGTPQLTMDGDVLSGYVNIYGAKYGEAKIKRKWITLQDMVFSCSASREEPKNFSFSIRGIDVDAADKKEVKMKGAFKLSKDGEVYLFIEALNMLDAGHLLKKLVSASMITAPKTTSEGRPASSSAEESGMVARLLASFETSAADQTDGGQRRFSTISQQSTISIPEETYDDIALPPKPEDNYENSIIKAPPQDSAERRKKFRFKLNRSRQSTVEEPGLYDDTVSPTLGKEPEDFYDDIDVLTSLPSANKTTAQKKSLSLPSEDRIPAVFEDLYLEVISETDAVATASPTEASPAIDTVHNPNLLQAPSTPQSRIKNFKLNFRLRKDNEKEVISPTESAPEKTDKKETDKERKQREKREKKEEKKKREKDKKKKNKEKEVVEEVEAVTPSTPTTPSTPSTQPTPSTLEASEKKDEMKKDEMKKQSPNLQRKFSAPVNKFKGSNMSHLLVKDKLMQDRKKLETQQKDLNTKKADLRAKKMSASDPIEKDRVQKEIDVIQKELGELNKKLVKISTEIEDATGDSKDANANKTGGTSAIAKRTSVRALSPDREKVSKGTVSDRMKMFQQDK